MTVQLDMFGAPVNVEKPRATAFDDQVVDPTFCTWPECGARIGYVITRAGKRMPVDLEGDNRGRSHFAVCPGADHFRKSPK